MAVGTAMKSGWNPALSRNGELPSSHGSIVSKSGHTPYRANRSTREETGLVRPAHFLSIELLILVRQEVLDAENPSPDRHRG
ncbi:hypothetical protein MNBD_ACTINO01-93, partial [hydrothermal vent metagenome]